MLMDPIKDMRFQMCSLLVSVGLLFSQLVPCASSTQCNFPAIFNFGDSNSDTGGLSASFSPIVPPYGETFFGTVAGRSSDGRLVIDFIAESLGLPYLSAYLDSVGSNFSHGANFATSGSTIRPQNTTISKSGYSPVSLDVQLVEFFEFRRRSQMVRKRGGVFENLLPEETDFSGALYTIDIGQNDLTAGYDLNMTTEQVKANVPDMVGQLSNVIKDIYARGGRSFWIHNTGPLGCLTYVLVGLPATAQMDKYGCSLMFNEVSQYFNLQLKEAVNELRNDLPLAAITYVDIYSVKYYLISHAKELGFDDPFLVCCGGGGRFNYNRSSRCGTTGIVNGTEVIIANSCKDPSSRINWDGVHFTEAANKWIFENIVNGSFSNPPVPLHSACQRMSLNNSYA